MTTQDYKNGYAGSEGMSAIVLTPIRQQSIDELWAEAETLGYLRVWTQTEWKTTHITGYDVTLLGKKRNTDMEIKRSHPSLACAIADCINEAREMGLGSES